MFAICSQSFLSFSRAGPKGQQTRTLHNACAVEPADSENKGEKVLDGEFAPRPLSENPGIESTRPKPWFRHVGGSQENFSDEDTGAVRITHVHTKHSHNAAQCPVLGQTSRGISYRIFMFRDPAEQDRSARQTCSPRFLTSHQFEMAATAVVHRKTEDPPGEKKKPDDGTTGSGITLRVQSC
jgi:hypothetical protein